MQETVNESFLRIAQACIPLAIEVDEKILQEMQPEEGVEPSDATCDIVRKVRAFQTLANAERVERVSRLRTLTIDSDSLDEETRETLLLMRHATGIIFRNCTLEEAHRAGLSIDQVHLCNEYFQGLTFRLFGL